MYRFVFILFSVIAVFFSCNSDQKKEKQKKKFSFSPPITITATEPIVILIDTCPKPNIIVLPLKGSKKEIIQTQSGSLTIQLSPITIVPIHAGEAGGYAFMQNFNTEQGLGLSTICCGYKDKSGNLWFGTSGGGVSKYNGKSFTSYTASQGLANNIVRCILEDKKGNLWFGTNGGLSKYDGKYFTNFTTEQGLTSNRVLSIAEDKNGNLWFSTDKGISRLAPDASLSHRAGEASLFTNFTIAQGLASNDVVTSITDKKGNLWFGTNQGISKFIPDIKKESGAKSFKNYTTTQGLGNNYVMSIGEDKFGNIWFGTLGGGISKYNPDIKEDPGVKFLTTFNHTQGLLNDWVTCITEDKAGNLWFGTGAGISKYDPTFNEGVGANQFTNFTVAQGLSNISVSCVTEDKTGSLWVGSSMGGGLCKYDGKSFTKFTQEQGLVYNKVWGITEDKKENLWFVASSGICKYDRKSFTNYSIDHIFSNVRSVIEDKRGNMWFGSSLGVTKYDGQSFTNYNIAQGLPYQMVLSMAEDKLGNIWFGTYGGGVIKYDGNRVEALEAGKNSSLENILDLKKINGKFVKSFTRYTTAQGLADNTVKCIIEDKRGSMWFGTNGGGISKYTCSNNGGNSTFTNYSRAQGLSNNTILSVREDKAGNLWMGTAGGGVCKYDPLAKDSIGSKPFTIYTSAQGLAEDMIYAIAEDTTNNIIWFGTNLGLSGLKLNSASSGTEGAKFENFNNNTGYPIKDVNTSALFLDKKGIIWAGTSDMLIRFDYSSIHKCAEPPVVFIQSIKIQGSTVIWYNLKSVELNGAETNVADSLAILNEEVITNGHPLSEVQRHELNKKFSDIKFDSISRFYPLPVNLVLPFKHNNITFDFLAIETTRPFLVNYQYMLEGYDKEWSPVTDKTSATFGNIYEGTYTFKLKAQSPDGVWSQPVIYTFKVLPPWYRTWWMYLSYLIIVLSVILLFLRWRTASLRKEKEILEQTVIERTTEVVEQKELIEEKQKEIVDSINYAKRIQYTLLADDSVLQQNLNEYFILLLPKDIVSGDFYWATLVVGSDELRIESEKKSTRFYLAICDSTGHGVPGAFMSLLNISFLNEAITEKQFKQPNEILNHVRQRLIESVSQDGAQDGMDGILLCFESPSPLERDGRVKLTYSASNNAPVIVRDSTIINLPADKMPVGKGEQNNSFTLHSIETKKGDMLYLFSDGYADQFGGPKGKKFKNKQLEEVLVSIHQKPMEEQKQLLADTIEKWKGNLEQVDDILIAGIRIG